MRELLTAKVIELDIRSATVAGISEGEVPLATEHITINGKRATRLRAERALTKTGLAGPEEEGPGAQTIVISPTKAHREASSAATGGEGHADL